MSSRQLQTNSKENPTLELKIVSASDVSHIDGTDKIDVYAVVSINGETTPQKQAAKTPIDFDGGPNPTWNHTVKFSINEKEANDGLLAIKVKLFSYWLEGENDLLLGEVNVSVQELLASNPIPPFTNGNVDKMKSMICPIKVTGENTKSTLTLSYRFKPVPVDDSFPPAAPDYSPSIGQPVYPNPDPGQLVVYSPRFQTANTKIIIEMLMKFAKDIENVNAFSAMDVYASVAILKDRKVKDRFNTPIDFSANSNPNWDHKIKFSLDDKLVQEGRLILLVQLMSHRPFLGDKEIGFVRIPIKQLLESNPPAPLTKGDDGNGMRLETHALTGPYGKKGVVSFMYRFLAEQVTVSNVKPSSTTPHQQYIMYLPVSPQSYASSDPSQGTSGYVNGGSSNGLVPIYMPPTYQSHGYQQYSPRQSKLQPHSQPPPKQSSQLQPQ